VRLGFWSDHVRPRCSQDRSGPPMSDTSGPPSEGFVASSTPKKPWRPPLVIIGTSVVSTNKLPVPHESVTEFGSTIGPS